MRIDSVILVLTVLSSSQAWAQIPPSPTPATVADSPELASSRDEWEEGGDVTPEAVLEHDETPPWQLHGGIGFGVSERDYQTDLNIGLGSTRFGRAGPRIRPTGPDQVEVNVAVGVPDVRVRLVAETDRLDLSLLNTEVGSADVPGRVRIFLRPLAVRALFTAMNGGPSQHYGALEPRAGVSGEIAVPLWSVAEFRARLEASVGAALGAAHDGDSTEGVLGMLWRAEGGVEFDFAAADWRIFADFIYQAMFPGLDTMVSMHQLQINAGIESPEFFETLRATAGFNLREDRADLRSHALDPVSGSPISTDSGSANFTGATLGLVGELP